MKQTSIGLVSIFLVSLACQKPVEQVTPTLENITESVYASGIVKSQNQYQVYPKVSGIIETLFVNEGDSISKGQVLMKIFNPTAQLSVENATLAAANAALKANSDKLKDLGISIDLAYKKLQSDSLLWVRQSNLWKQQIGSKIELEQRELAYHNAQAAYQSALLKYRDLQKQLTFSAKQSQTNVAISQALAADYFLKSEYNGRVYSLLKEKGEMVNPQTPIATIGDAQAFELALQIDEDDVVRVQPNQKVVLTLDSYAGEVFEAIVTSIDPLMNEKTRTFTVKAHFVKQPKVLYPNLNVEANIVLRSKQKALTIPRNYLIDEAFVLNEKAEKIPVKIGLKDYQKVEILAGLSPRSVILKPSK